MDHFLHAPDHANEVTAPLLPPAPNPPQADGRFISIRWRFLIPIATIILIICTVGAYLLAYGLTSHDSEASAQELTENTNRLLADFQSLSDTHQRELFRLSNTSGVQESIAAQNTIRLQELIIPNASLANIDLVIVTGVERDELIGLTRQQNENGQLAYIVSQNSDLSQLNALQSVLNGNRTYALELARLDGRLLLVSTEQVFSPNGQALGTLTIGSDIAPTLVSLTQRYELNISLYSPNGQALYADNATYLDAETRLSIGDNDIVTTSTINDDLIHQKASTRLSLVDSALGYIVLEDTIDNSTATGITQQAVSISAAALTAMILIAVYSLVARVVVRLEKVRDTAIDLAEGKKEARNHMKARDEIGEIAVALDYFADVVEHEQAVMGAYLNQHRQESSRLMSILDSIQDGILLLDAEGRPLMLNSRARQMLALNPDMLTIDLREIISDTLGAAVMPSAAAAQATSRVAHRGHVLQTQSLAIQNQQGGTAGILVTLRDVSEEVRKEQRLEVLLDELVSDIQSPIATVAQEAALAATHQEDKSKDRKLFSFARSVARNAQALQRVIADLRDLQTFGAQDVERIQQPILVSELIWDVAAQWQEAANNANIDMTIQIPQDEYYILGDARRLGWALSNIIDNAIKYSPSGSDIVIYSEWAQDAQSAHIVIKDTGVGITAEQLPHIFKRFYRGTPIAPDGKPIQVSGTGQGLYLSKRVIEAHGGSISLESSAGSGTTVHCWLPLTANITLTIAEDFNLDEQRTRETIVPRVIKQLFQPEERVE